MTDEQISIKASLALQSIHNSMWEDDFKRSKFLAEMISEMPVGELNGCFRNQAERYFAEIDKAKAMTISEHVF